MARQRSRHRNRRGALAALIETERLLAERPPGVGPRYGDIQIRLSGKPHSRGGNVMGRAFILWLLGVPASLLIILWLLGVFH
jgi:hypothetical protein